jgi:hypothetical protein
MTLPQPLLASRETGHAETNAQRPSNYNTARAWLIWKHCNSCVFNGERPSVQSVNETTKAEAALYARAGVLGLRTILHVDWDVH